VRVAIKANILGFALFCTVLFGITRAAAESISVRYLEGLSHGFLVLRTQDGRDIAGGESTQSVRGNHVTSHLRFRFKDGSTYEDTTTFTQHRRFRLLSNHVLQKGPAFKTQMETYLDATTGDVRVHYMEDGKEKTLTQRLELPADVANGLLFTLVKNIQSDQKTLAYVAFSPKPRLVKLVITPEGQDTFLTGTSTHKAIHYILKVQIGGVAGVVAPIIGKQPPDTDIWVLDGEAPSYVGSEGPLYGDGPVWRIDLVSPVRQKDESGGHK
jgi:hypothetical protein